MEQCLPGNMTSAWWELVTHKPSSECTSGFPSVAASSKILPLAQIHRPSRLQLHRVCKVGGTLLRVERIVSKALTEPGAYEMKTKGDNGILQSPAWGSCVHTSERLSLEPPHHSPSNREGGPNYGAIAPFPKAATTQCLLCFISEDAGRNPSSSPPYRSQKIILTTWWPIQKHIFFRKLSRINKDETFSEGIGDEVLAPQGLMASLRSAQEGQDAMLYFQGMKYCLIVSVIQTP